MEIKMIQHPTISVLMSVYNGEKYLREAVESILNQTFGDFEFIIFNDASNDKSEEIIESFKDPRIILINNKVNLGLTKNLNKGILIARGEYIARMDADDISAVDRFRKQKVFFDENPDYGLCGSWTKVIDDVYQPFYFPELHDEIKFGLLSFNCLVHSTVMWRKSLFRQYKFLYDENFITSQDYELWSRVVQKIKIRNIADYLLFSRVHEGQISLRKIEKQNTNASQIKVRQLSLLELSPSQDELISHLCLFDEQFKIYRGHERIKAADLWMYKIFLQNRIYNVYNEELLVIFWRNKLFGNNLYSYDLKIWKVLNNSKCLQICKVPLSLKFKQFVKCLIKWSINKK